MNKNLVRYLIIVFIVIIVFAIGICTIFNNYKNVDEEKKQKNINIVSSPYDSVLDDTIWCGTFDIVWNELKNNLAKQDIVFSPQLKEAENLNKELFKKEYISDEFYYVKVGKASKALKNEILTNIKEKFKETSNIINEFNFEDEGLFIYSMLKKEFKFEKKFEELPKSSFKNYDNISYFGIKKDSNKTSLNDQVSVLYYDSEESFAIKLLTKGDDRIIICKNPIGNNFSQIYNNLVEKEKNYTGNKTISSQEELKIPNININEKKEFTIFENKEFYFSNGEKYNIEKAIQEVSFCLNRNGGIVKSEAAMGLNKISNFENEKRSFIVNDTFAIFIKEEKSDFPYFAAKISDITKFQ